MFKKHNSPIFFALLATSLMFCKSVYSQGYVSWYSESDRGVHRVSILNGSYVVFYENNVDTLPDYQVDWSTEGIPMSYQGHLFDIGDDLYAVFSGSNMVFKLDTALQRIYRVDRTIYSGYNFDAYQFKRNDTIYSFGGYGFWIENNLLTYYSNVRKEWSVYSTAPYNPYTPDYEENKRTYKITFYDSFRDVLYVLRLDRVYKYDFKKHTWEVLGTLALDDIFPERFKLATAMTHRLSDTTCLLFNGQKTYLIDLGNNELKDVTLPSKINTSNASGLFDRLGLACGYDLANELLLVKHSDKVPVGYIFERINRVNNRAITTNAVYKRIVISNSLKLNIALFAFLILGGFLTFKIRNRYLKKRSQYYSEEQWKFIQAIDKKALSTDELNMILNLNDSSWEVQRRRRSEFIKNMNELSMNQLGCELVERRRSSEDKRQVVYTMNADAKSKLARLM